jgi:hypothetical protein
LIKTYNISETGVCLRHQVKDTYSVGPIDRASPDLRKTEVIGYKEEDITYTWKIRRRKPVTNYMNQERACNSDRAFIQIKFHDTSTRK